MSRLDAQTSWGRVARSLWPIPFDSTEEERPVPPVASWPGGGLSFPGSISGLSGQMSLSGTKRRVVKYRDHFRGDLNNSSKGSDPWVQKRRSL